MKMKTVKKIRRFSHFKHENVIREDIDVLAPEDAFVNGMPMSFHEAVDNGIRKYTVPKKRERSVFSETSSEGEPTSHRF